MRCSSWVLPAVLVLALVGGLAPTLLADGVVRDGMGAISTGRGATNLGFADNAAIIYDNPAAMTNVAGSGLLELSIDTVVCDLHYTDPDNDVNNIHRGYPAGMVGYIWRDPDSCWAYGIGGFAPAGFGAEFDTTNPHTGPARYMSLGLVAKLLPALAYQVTDRLSIGGTLGVALGHNELEGPFYIQTGPLAGAPTLLDLQATGAAVTGGIGLQYHLTPRTTLGLAYTEETQFDLDGPAQATVITPLGPLESRFDADARLVWPRSLGIGLKHDLTCCHRFGIDVIWYDWSSAFDQLDLVFSNPSNPVVAGLLGPEIRDTFPIGWHDTVSYRFGYEWDANPCLTWRLGYIYHESPVPDDTLNPYLDGVLEHTLSAGLSYRLRRGTLSLAYQYSFGPERQVGDSAIVGDDFSNSTFEAEAHWANISWLIAY